MHINDATGISVSCWLPSSFIHERSAILINSMDIDKVLLELPDHFADLFKVLLIESWVIILGLVGFLQEPILGKGHGGLESCRLH